MDASTPRMTVLKAHRSVAALLIGTTLCAIYVLLSPNAADDTFMNVLSGILAIAFIPLCLERLALRPSRQARAIWATIAVLLTIVAFQEFARLVAPSVRQFDDLGELVLLVGSLAIAVLLARFDPVPRLATMILCIGFAVQCLATMLDCLDRALVARFAVDSDLLARVMDFAQFIAIQVYFGAALLFLLSLSMRRGSATVKIWRRWAISRAFSSSMRGTTTGCGIPISSGACICRSHGRSSSSSTSCDGTRSLLRMYGA
jgi:hypothetical protein